LFQNNRHDANVAYRFDVPNGTYQVRLRFAEIYAPTFGVGRRIFNVASGALSLSFSSVVSQPAVSAIEIIATGAGAASATPTSTATATPTLTPTPGAMPTAPPAGAIIRRIRAGNSSTYTDMQGNV
jgi:hypothetical protein